MSFGIVYLYGNRVGCLNKHIQSLFIIILGMLLKNVLKKS